MRGKREKKPEKDEFDDDDLDFHYEGEPPRPNLLDYRHMFIQMTRWAYVDSSCLTSVVVAIIVTFSCLIMLTAYALLVNSVGH